MQSQSKTTTPTPTLSGGQLKARFSPIFLVAANLLPLIGVLFWDWTVASVVIFYWSENLIIGFYNVLKMLSKGFDPTQRKAWFLALFFLIHYGGFCAAHGFFVVELFDLQTTSATVAAAPDWPGPLMVFALIWEAAQRVLAIAPPYWLWGFAAMFVSHGFSFLNHWFGGEQSRTRVDELMTAPYRRIFIMQAVVIFGGLGIQELGSPLPLLLLLVLLKTGLDLDAHRREHGLSWRALATFQSLSVDSERQTNTETTA